MVSTSECDWAAVGLTAFAFFALFRLRWGMLRTLGLSAGLGCVYYLLTFT